MSEQQSPESVLAQSSDPLAALGALGIKTAAELDAAVIQMERLNCIRSFYYFVRQAWTEIQGQSRFVDNWHLAALCYHFQALYERQFDTLVVNISPNCSKSTVATVLLPIWVWLNDPSAGLWLGSFSQKLCSRDADRMRELIKTEWFQKHFGNIVRLREDQGQLLFYHNEAGGWRLSATIGSKSGFGMHPRILGIDDPHNPKEAGSATYCRIACEYWTDTLASRGILANVVKFQIAQRLSENDLTSHILRLHPDCVHLRIPMRFEPHNPCVTKIRYHDIDDIDENGYPRLKNEWVDPRAEKDEMMWPDFFTEEKLRAAQMPMRAHQIAGQYQQNPTAPQGDMFRLDWFGAVVDKPPEDGRAVRAWDKASSTGNRSDYTAGVLIVFDGQYYYVVDVVRGKWERKERDSIIRKTAESDAELYPSYEIRFEREGASAGKDAASIQAEELSSEFRVFIDRALGKPKSLEDDAKGWDVWCDLLARGLVKIVKGAWNDAFIREHLAAPLGRNDDMVDASAHAARTLVGTGRRRKITRKLLLLTEEEQQELAGGPERQLCPDCLGLGCAGCRHSGHLGATDRLADLIPPVPDEDAWMLW